jgi:glycosyltransferase involved in cell wall biosynthesis
MTGAPAVLWVGRLNTNKDPLTLLDAFEHTAQALPSATLTMVFHEDHLLTAAKERIAASTSLHDRVRLVGAVPHERMASFFSAADLFVVGSHHEGSGYALMEAMACGAIPIVTDIPAFRALTASGSIGALWTPGNAAACARALVDVASRDLSAERQRVVDHFRRRLTWDAIGGRAMEIYRQVAARRRGGPMRPPP